MTPRATKSRNHKAVTAAFAALLLVIASVPFLTDEYASDGSLGAGGIVEPMISAGGSHSLALKNDGTVWAWGNNGQGQLGDGTTVHKTEPMQVPGLSNVTSVAAGSSHSLALKDNGTVWAWGANDSGQLGDGTAAQKNTPAQVPGLSNVTSVAAGSNHSLALKDDGTVWTWGNNDRGQLGDGTAAQKNTPVQVFGLSDVTAIAAGSSHSLILKDDGRVWAWGNNDHGQLGNSTNASNNIPVPTFLPASLTYITAIAAGGNHSLAIGGNMLWSWGDNSSGQLGNGKSGEGEFQDTPAWVFGAVKAIAAGSSHSLALTDNGTVLAWGNNRDGQLGDGNIRTKDTPVQVVDGNGTLRNVTTIAAGEYHSLALKDDGTVWSWGANGSGQLGDGTAGGGMGTTKPVQVKNIELTDGNDNNNNLLMIILAAAALIVIVGAVARASMKSKQ